MKETAMKSTKRIIIDIITEGDPSPIGMSIERITREVSIDYNLVYTDRMKADIYYKSLSVSDPIRNLERFLSGLEQWQSCENRRSDSGKFISRIKMIWRKFFCQDF